MCIYFTVCFIYQIQNLYFFLYQKTWDSDKETKKEQENDNEVIQEAFLEMMKTIPPLDVLLGNFKPLMWKGRFKNLLEKGVRWHAKSQDSEWLWNFWRA